MGHFKNACFYDGKDEVNATYTGGLLFEKGGLLFQAIKI